ncbi:hypothetical protein GRI62_00290 [Erythrobacter arachoides]|uniref:Uncharacterized protein n=1 Tax=Aurantiacibacter arachoides TaxID=1850444 RepID=A0A844ZVH7_9SPHN|nr:hypothetical protein [Aurantiacibacter arachoides]MXO92043.1 hypothetical protein [Aurantiacibacter arachoides]GGD60197.1 hypothetical protein GCM10011411_20470 [Aurantiacibacter arachoides]
MRVDWAATLFIPFERIATMFRNFTISAALCAATAVPALAQTGDPYAACAGLADDAQRLACFDTTYSAQRVVIAEAEARTQEEIATNFGRRDADEAFERDDVSITAEVAEVFFDGSNRSVVRLANGQIWREVSGSSMRGRPREGMEATISRHWSGVYEMRFTGRSGYKRVARIG